jgi:hypothetical protein
MPKLFFKKIEKIILMFIWSHKDPEWHGRPGHKESGASEIFHSLMKIQP